MPLLLWQFIEPWVIAPSCEFRGCASVIELMATGPTTQFQGFLHKIEGFEKIRAKK